LQPQIKCLTVLIGARWNAPEHAKQDIYRRIPQRYIRFDSLPIDGVVKLRRTDDRSNSPIELQVGVTEARRRSRFIRARRRNP
jgi:hypothetical protein